MKYLFSLIIGILLFSVNCKVFAQDTESVVIQGQVKDSITGEALVGAVVFVKGTQKGTTTNAQGNYSLELFSGNYVFEIKYIGYVSKELRLNVRNGQTLNVLLAPDVTELNEVKITAQRLFFGNMEYGRSIPTIKAEIIGKQNTNNASDILHASVAGVWATKTSGAPGDHQKIRIRGQNSLFTSAEPLYVIDGVPVPIVNLSSLGIADLNIHDIDNVTILKDASSTALYGFQGGNGVVLIDTKQGGKNEINFSTKFGFQWFDNFYDLMNTEEQLASFDVAKKNIGVGVRAYYPLYSDSLCSHNRQQEVFSNGQVQEYQLSASGSKDKFKYYFSGNYTDHKGVLPNSEYKRYTFSTRLGQSFGKRVTINLAYRGSRQENDNNQDEYNGNTLLFEGISATPCLECIPDSLIYDEYGNEYNRTYNTRLNGTTTPQSIIDYNTHSLDINAHALNALARIQITDNLSMDFMESFMYHHSDFNLVSGYKVKSKEDVILINHQFNLSYNKSFGKHSLNGVLAFRRYTDNLWWNVDSLSSELPDNYMLKNSMAAYGVKGSVLRNLTSYIGHLSYNFNNTFFASAVANASRVKEGIYTDYYEIFPSLALSCDVAKLELFNSLSWLDQLNFYTNWGVSGNYPLNGLSNDLFEDVVNTSGQTTAYYPALDQFANHHLKHESTSETDFGLKSSFLKNRIVVSAVYFNKNIENLIIQRTIPSYYGGGKIFLNIGAIAVDGIELGFEIIPIETKSVVWHNQFSFSKSVQSVTRLLDDEDMKFASSDILMPDFLISVGKPIGDIYGYKMCGRWTDADQQAKNAGSNQYIKSNDMKFLNADSTNRSLDANDKVVIGNSIPDYTWNFNSTIQYKNLSLSMTWYAAIGMEKYNATRAATIMTGVNTEVNNYINDSLKIVKSNFFYQSNEFVEDASFIKLKTLSLSYELPKKIFGSVACNFILSAENLLTFTRYKGYDPEATIFTDNNFSDNAVDRGAYPNPKSVYAIINLKF